MYIHYEHIIYIRNLAIFLEWPHSLFKTTICLKNITSYTSKYIYVYTQY